MATIPQKIANMLTRAVVSLISQDETKGKVICQVLGLADEIKSEVEYLQPYGLRSIPLKGSRGILLAYGGSKSNATMINIDDKRFGKFSLQEGDVCIYSKNGAHTIYRDNDIIEILSGTRTITIGGMTAVISSSGIEVTGGDIIADGISLKNHVHAGSPSAPDGAVSDTGSPQ